MNLYLIVLFIATYVYAGGIISWMNINYLEELDPNFFEEQREDFSYFWSIDEIKLFYRIMIWMTWWLLPFVKEKN